MQPELFPEPVSNEGSSESLINLTSSQFTELMQTQGLDNTVRGVLEIADEELETYGVPLTVESLANGNHPILDKLDRYKGIAPENRKISPEEILTLFTNVDDFGKFDPKGGSFSGLKAGTYAAARAIPETVGAGLGFKAGLAAATPFAAMIPPLGPAAWVARGLVYTIGGVGGAIAGAIAASEAEDAVIGEADPVLPSLQPAANAGETLMLAGSMLVSPYKLISSIPKAKTGALEFLENFKNVSGGKISEEVFSLVAKNAGMSQKAADKTYAAAMAARESSTRGAMFGADVGVKLGFTRFNPAGYLVDPRKGGIGTRAIGGIEKGIESSFKYARENPGKFLGLETLYGGGMATGAYLAQEFEPYDPSARLGYEIAGSFLIPLPVQAAVSYAPDLVGVVKRWYGNAKNKEGILASRMEKSSVERIMAAIRKSEEYANEIDPNTGELIRTADEKFATFIDELNKASIDEQGNPIKFTTADLAETAGLDFSPTIRTIQNELEKSSTDLAVATGRGREEMQAGAVNAIRTLVATGDPQALAAAARIQQGLFEQNIIDNVESSVTKLTDAATTVVGRDLKKGSEQIDLSKQLYTILENQIRLSKERERRLWNEVGTAPLTQFFNRKDEALDQPNVLELMDRPAKEGGLTFSSKGAQKELNDALGGYKDDIQDLREYFNPESMADAASPSFASQTKKLNDALEALDPSDKNKIQSFLEQQELANVSPKQVIDGLRDRAKQVMEKQEYYVGFDYKFGTRPGSRELAKAYNAQAVLLGAQDDAATTAKATMVDIVNPATSEKFFQMRSGLLSKAAALRKDGKLSTARHVDQINDALLRDLTGQKNDVTKGYDAARAYTFARNNVFTRSFINDLQTIDKQRGLIMSPESLLKNALQGGSNATVQRFEQIRAAGKFLINEGYAEDVVGSMTADRIMTEGLRDSLSKVMSRKEIPDPANPSETIETFFVDPQKLNTYKQQGGTKELFEFLPDLEKDLTDAATAKNAFDNMLGNVADTMNPSKAKQLGFNDDQLNTLYDTKAFQWVLQFEDPGEAVALALKSDRPTKALNSLYRMANESPMQGSDYTREQALSGLKSAIINNALVKSNNSSGLPNGDVLQKELFGQLEGVDPSVKFSMEDFLVKKGLATEEEMTELQKAVKTMRGVEEAFVTGDFENVLFKNPSLAKLFYVRIAGATAGSAVQNKMMSILGLPRMSGGLIAEQTGSEVTQKLLLRGPESQRIKIMSELFANPKTLSALMKTINNKKDLDNAMTVIEKVMAPLARQVGRRIPLGVRAATEDSTTPVMPEEENQIVPPPISLPVEEPQAFIPPSVERMQLPSQQIQQAPQVTASGPVDRERFAQFFPEDRDLVSGIGSLMG